ncbi:MAG: hypothetical protein O2960_01065 [Verrucomicrobia bacterium]|nr:hypothetical protein [Verrucomicrobiota bacterium]
MICRNEERRAMPDEGPAAEAARWRLFLRCSLLIALTFLLPACASVGPDRQRLVSKPNMLFSDTAAFNYQSKLLIQTESGSGFVAGGKAAGCTSCR